MSHLFSLYVTAQARGENHTIRPWSAAWLASKFQLRDLDSLQSGEQYGDICLSFVVDNLRGRVWNRSDQVFLVIYPQTGWVLGAVVARLRFLAISLGGEEVIVT